MTESGSPVDRSIGLAGVVRWLIAVAAVVAIGAAFADGHYALGVAGVAFFVAAATLAYRAWRARQAAAPAPPRER